MQQGVITPVLLGSAKNENGILRLMKSLRHDVAGVRATCERLGIDPDTEVATGYVMAAFFLQQGKMTLARLFTGALKEGDTIYGANDAEARVGSLLRLMGQEAKKLGNGLSAGDVAAMARTEGLPPGTAFATDKAAIPDIAAPKPPQPVYGLAITVPDSKDEVKLSQALARLIEEDPSLAVEHNLDTGELVLWGQGEMHLRVALDKLKQKFGVTVEAHPRSIAFKETIRKPAKARGRHKKQTGGHGQYGDVILEIRPLGRGEGFQFTETIHGGVVPKQYIPAVEAGVIEYNRMGPLGFPVVDIAVNLADGSYHTVDSSELAFKMAARLAMEEAMKDAQPVLLEPIVKVTVQTPQEATSRIVQLITGHRGQILGFEPREGWPGWDTVEALMPEMEMGELINELRSATAGVGSFTWAFDHLQEVTGKLAEEIVTRFGRGAAQAA
jgi:elongation factor G